MKLTTTLAALVLALAGCDAGPAPATVTTDATADTPATICGVLEAPPLSCWYGVTSDDDAGDIVCAGATAGERWALPGDVCAICPPRDPTQPAASYGLVTVEDCSLEDCAAGACGP